MNTPNQPKVSSERNFYECMQHSCIIINWNDFKQTKQKKSHFYFSFILVMDAWSERKKKIKKKCLPLFSRMLGIIYKEKPSLFRGIELKLMLILFYFFSQEVSYSPSYNKQKRSAKIPFSWKSKKKKFMKIKNYYLVMHTPLSFALWIYFE